MAEKFNRSECKIVKVYFTWENVQVPFLQTTDGNGKSIASPLFSSQEIPDSQWELVMYDGGTILKIRADHYCISRKASQKVEPELFKISIMKENGHTCHHGQMLSIHPGWREIPKSEVSPQANGGITFDCTIIVLVPKSELVSSVDPNCIAIDCSNGLSTQFQELFDGMQLSDVILNIGGREFPAHKLILAARSEVFASMFEHSTEGKLTNKIDIEDVGPEVFQELLRFIYTGRLNSKTMESMGVGLLIAADKYLLEDLKIECENYLLRKLSPVNCLEILLNENLPGPMEQLKERAGYFLRCNGEKVIATDKWKKLKKENPTLLSEIQQMIFF